jgi:tetratricopeptide (TPR) repeat protein
VSLYYLDFSADAASLRERANADSFQAVELDRSDVNGWVARSNALRINGNIKAALEASLTAEKLDPSRFGVLGARGWHYLDAGEPKETLKLVEQLRSLFGTHDSTLAAQACAAQVLLGAYDKAVVECERAESSFDNWNRYANLAAAYAMRGDLAKAEESKRKLMKAVPTFTLASYEARFHPVLPPESAEMDKATYVAGLRKAGVPER